MILRASARVTASSLKHRRQTECDASNDFRSSDKHHLGDMSSIDSFESSDDPNLATTQITRTSPHPATSTTGKTWPNASKQAMMASAAENPATSSSGGK
jgi:hypothetical protein